ncbi:MAG TPA: hypothetical protein VD789_09120, partial [Thermomicrobiales bacterium]|nr:hypothetical protein [Thermomicrobiales bacterium]
MVAGTESGSDPRLAVTRTGRRRWSRQARSEALLAMWFVLPAMLTIALIAFLPLGRAFWLSLWEINLRFANTPRVFVGLDNYWD